MTPGNVTPSAENASILTQTGAARIQPTLTGDASAGEHCKTATQSPSTALPAGKCLLLELCKESVKES